MINAFATGDSARVIANNYAGGDWGRIIFKKESKVNRATLAGPADLDYKSGKTRFKVFFNTIARKPFIFDAFHREQPFDFRGRDRDDSGIGASRNG